jgi:fused signal recognition particle receptor
MMQEDKKSYRKSETRILPKKIGIRTPLSLKYNRPVMAELFSRWRAGLARTSKAAFGRLAGILGATEITDGTWEQLESTLIQADLGIETTETILDSLKKTVREQGLTKSGELRAAMEKELRSRLDALPSSGWTSKPMVIMLVGVNGSGKTTTAAKLGRRYAEEGKRVVLIAADTFRAAAVDQLQVWADRLELPVISGQMGSDPGAVVFDGIQSALAKGYDVVLIDTAGRLHTRYNLMEELKKVYRVANKALPGAPQEVWLVLDSTTGQNALAQARAFKEAVGVTGVILAKLDSSARGGMAFAIQHDLGLPILFAGLGEQAADLVPFNPDVFVKEILAE